MKNQTKTHALMMACAVAPSGGDKRLKLVQSARTALAQYPVDAKAHSMQTIKKPKTAHLGTAIRYIVVPTWVW